MKLSTSASGTAIIGALLVVGCSDVLVPAPGHYAIIISEQPVVSYVVEEDWPYPANLAITLEFTLELRNLDGEPLRLMGCRDEESGMIGLPWGWMQSRNFTEERARDSYHAHCDSPALFLIPVGGSERFDVVLLNGGMDVSGWNYYQSGGNTAWFLTPTGIIVSPTFDVPTIP